MSESESIATHRPRLLLLEDEKPLRELMRHFFGYLGYDVWATEQPDEAQAVLDFRTFDLLITDLALSGDGPEAAFGVLDHARDRNPGLGIIVLTGLHDSELESECHRHGADQFLLKPQPLLTLARSAAHLAPPDASLLAGSPA